MIAENNCLLMFNTIYILKVWMALQKKVSRQGMLHALNLSIPVQAWYWWWA